MAPAESSVEKLIQELGLPKGATICSPTAKRALNSLKSLDPSGVRALLREDGSSDLNQTEHSTCGVQLITENTASALLNILVQYRESGIEAVLDLQNKG